MSVLYLRSRPIVAFDVSNPEHRRYYADFVKYKTWGKCPVRFMAESLDLDLVTYVSDKMLEYYVKQEFGNGKNKTKNKAKPKSKGAPRTVRSKQSVQAQTSQEPS